MVASPRSLNGSTNSVICVAVAFVKFNLANSSVLLLKSAHDISALLVLRLVVASAIFSVTFL